MSVSVSPSSSCASSCTGTETIDAKREEELDDIVAAARKTMAETMQDGPTSTLRIADRAPSPKRFAIGDAPLYRYALIVSLSVLTITGLHAHSDNRDFRL